MSLPFASFCRLTAGLMVALLWASPALAADFALTQGSFGAGFRLPLEHLAVLLSFLAIGLWSGQLGGRMVWQLMVITLGGVLLASLIAAAGVVPPIARQGLLLVPVVIGALIVLGLRLPPLLSPPVVVAVATIFVGYPLGLLISHDTHLMPWLGYDAAALLALTSGLGLAVLVIHLALPFGVRALGGTIAAAGLMMLLDKL